MLVTDLSAEPTLEEVADAFTADKFATEACKCVVLEASKGHAVCEFTIENVHRNGFGAVMGGAIFTLADFTLAIACNIGEAPTVSISNTIEYMNSSRGTKLIAECNVNKSGRKVGFYTVDVRDDLGEPIARMVATCSR